MSGSVGFTFVGAQNIRAVLGNVRWNSTTINYQFTTSAAQYGGTAYDASYDPDGAGPLPPVTFNESTGWLQITSAFQTTAAEAAFREVERFTNLTINSAGGAGTADIRLAMTTAPDPRAPPPGPQWTAYAYGPNTGRGGDIWLNSTDYNTPRLGTYVYQTFFHEIGHALGLKHGHEAVDGNVAVLEPDRNSLEFSTMTYASHPGAATTGYTVDPGDYPQSFMMYDIAALQAMYGADYANVDTTYRFDIFTGQMFVNGVGQGLPQNDAGAQQNTLFRTIWDGGGWDIYDFTSYITDLSINLTPGAWSDVDRRGTFQAARLGTLGPGAADDVYARGQVFNALLVDGDQRSMIESALGGVGNDHIVGNRIGNWLAGGAGNDFLRGYAGDDRLDQDGGGGKAYGDAGNDTLVAGNGAETLNGGDDHDMVDYSRSTGSMQIDTTIGKVIGGWGFGDTLISIEDITATGFSDAIRMGDDANLILGGNGNDTLDGSGGADTLRGENGNDVLQGGSGADSLDGGADYDTARFGTAVAIDLVTGLHGGEAGGDTLLGFEAYDGSDATDSMRASGAAVVFFGHDGIDVLVGGNGNDTLQGGKQADVLDGGPGLDVSSYADAPNGILADMTSTIAGTDGKIIAGDWGTDTLTSIEGVEGTSFGDDIKGDERVNWLSGLGGHDRIDGNEGPDTMLGGAGDDTITAGAGDLADGGADHNTLRFEEDGAVNADFAAGLHSIGGVSLALANFETVFGTTANDTMSGSTRNEGLSGGSGTDILSGGSGRDTLVGGADNDSLVGQAHADLLQGDDGLDTLDGGTGNDTLLGGLGNDLLRGGTGADSLDGGDGSDFIDYRLAAAGVVVDLVLGGTAGDASGDAYLGVEHVYGSRSDDYITGDDHANSVKAGLGNDTIDGGPGADTLDGSTGNDVIQADSSDQVRGGFGQDTVAASAATNVTGFVFTVAGTAVEYIEGRDGDDRIDGTGVAYGLVMVSNIGNDTIIGGLADDVGFGGIGSDSMLGGQGFDQLYGQEGDDTLTGGGSPSAPFGDRLIGGDGNDRLTGSGNGILLGDAGNDTINAGVNDYVDGGADNDRVVGGSGLQQILGGAGNDLLTGGADADRFDFRDGWGADRITDFTPGLDQVGMFDVTGLSLFSQLMITDTAGGAQVGFAANTILFQGVSATSLLAEDFLL